MIHIENILQKSVSEAFKNLYNTEIEPKNLKFQPTRKEFEGSHTLTCFEFAKKAGKAPDAIGNDLGNYLLKNCLNISKFNVVKGFLNVSISNEYLINFSLFSNAKTNFDFEKNGEKVMVEYSSPNTNKPLHLGHLRNNFLGFAMANVFRANGFEVIKANLINDRGIHICKSMLAYLKFGNNETPDSSGLKGDKLVGKYYVEFEKQLKFEKAKLLLSGISEEVADKKASLMQDAQKMLLAWENGDTKVLALWNKMNNWVYEGFNSTYKSIGVSFDKFYYESNTYLLGKEMVEEGISNGIFYQKEDKSVWIDLTAEGLDHKLVLRSDGTSVYITQDMGTADLKYKEFGINKSIYVVGNEQDYHFNVLFLILKKMGKPYASGLHHLSYGMVDLPSGKMKSREGTVVDADDLVQEMKDEAQKQTTELGKIDGFSANEAEKLYENIGLAALKYYLIKVDPKKRMLFNPAESIDFHGNTGPFIQYTHARICAILRKSNELSISTNVSFGSLVLENCERNIITQILLLDKTIKQAAEEYSPSVIANYVYEVAKMYNSFYAELSIFQEKDAQKVAFRVLLSCLTGKVIKYCLEIIGIESPEKM